VAELTTKTPGEASVADLANAKEADIAAAIKQLSPDEAMFFLAKLEAVIAKRKLQLTGYLVAFVSWLIGMFFALAYFGTHDGFVGWVFLVPFAWVGLVLYLFGKWADKVGKDTQRIIERERQKDAAAQSTK